MAEFKKRQKKKEKILEMKKKLDSLTFGSDNGVATPFKGNNPSLFPPIAEDAYSLSMGGVG